MKDSSKRDFLESSASILAKPFLDHPERAPPSPPLARGRVQTRSPPPSLPPPPQLQFRILVSMSVAEGIQRLAAAGWAGPGKAGCEEHGNELMQRRSPPQRSAQSPPAEQRKGERGWEQEGEGRRGQRCQLEDTLPCWYSLHVPWSPTTTAREEI